MKVHFYSFQHPALRRIAATLGAARILVPITHPFTQRKGTA